MADGYVVGQGKIYLAPRNSTGRTGGYAWAGDADGFSLNASEDFLDFNESHSGARARVVHISLGKSAGFTLSLRRLDAVNLARAIHGTVGTTAGATVTGEALSAYNGSTIPLAFPGVSSVVINKAGTPLVLGTDYTVDAANGTITILPGSTAVASPTTATALTANYTYAAYGGTVQALVNSNQEFSLRYDGFSQTDGSAIIVNLHRVTFDLASDIALIGTDVAALEVGGAILPASEITGNGLSQFYTITRGA